jgi:HAD superfamily hydrolase (TIGR01484 family)
MTPKVVATDLDGTVIRSDGTISTRTRHALEAVAEAGGMVVIVTGRPPRWLRGIADATGHHGLAICANGAIVYDVGARRVQSVAPLARDAALAVVGSLREALPGTAFASEHSDGFAVEAHFNARHPVPPDVATGPIETLLDPLPAKLLARNEQLSPDEFIARGSVVVAGLADVHVSGATGLLEMSARGVSKAAALARWCEANGFDAAEVWAFGDMLNDLPMLAWAGTSFAVANAHPDVLAAATTVCRSNDDDGVARVVEEALAMRAALD